MGLPGNRFFLLFMSSWAKLGFFSGIFLLVVLLFSRVERDGTLPNPLVPFLEKTPSLRIRYFGEGRDLRGFAVLGEALFSQNPPEMAQLFRILSSFCQKQGSEDSLFSVRSLLFWDEQQSSWSCFVFYEGSGKAAEDLFGMGKWQDFENTFPAFRRSVFPEGILVFPRAFSEETSERFLKEAFYDFPEPQASLEWRFSDGGFGRKKYPAFFESPLLFNGDFSLFSGKGEFSWKLENLETLPEKMRNLPLWEKQALYLPLFAPFPLIAEGGCSDFTSLLSLVETIFTLDEESFLPEDWKIFGEKIFHRFVDVSLPMAFVLGGKSQAFQTIFPGILVHFPEGGERGCTRVENLWKRARFFLKPLAISEKALCGGLAPFPVNLLMVALEKETLGGMITEDSFRSSESSRSRYPLFFGNTPSCAWFILDLPVLHGSIREFLLEGRILRSIPFRFLSITHALENAVGELAFLGVLGCIVSGEGEGRVLFSSDIFSP